MLLKQYITMGFLISALWLQAQDMEKGFNYLETGKYDKAEVFFEAVLQEYPNNKTSRLCYGRAVGLNGNAKKANQLFMYLLHDYSQDFEVKLNYGESLLWLNKFETAERFYKNLVQESPESFPALLGYANTLSNLKEYKKALDFVNKALVVSPDNPNALTSKKYIYLGYAYQNQQSQNYDKSELLLTKNLELFKNDKETLLNLANLYLIWNKPNEAKSVYNRLAENTSHKIEALNGLALVAHINNKSKKALQLSTQTYGDLKTDTDFSLKERTTERYVQALIWNSKYKKAKTIIDSLNSEDPNRNWVLALRATLNIYKSNFKESLKDYNKILENDSTSFDGNLGKANVLKALGRTNAARVAAENTLKFYNNQKDAVKFISDINQSLSPILESKASHTFDNGDNKAYAFTNTVVYPLSTKFSVLGNYNIRSTNNTVTNASALSNNLSVGISYKLMPRITFKGIAGITTAEAQSKDFTQLVTDASLNIKAFKLQDLTLGYKRNIESFNAALLDQELVQNNYYANYNLNTNFKLGWFTQYMFTSQNDSNQRNLLFTSLYYNVLSKPILKVGLNYQYITFKNQVPTIYFSPEQFYATEVFITLLKGEAEVKPKQWFYNATAAFGNQYIEDSSKQSVFRFQGALGYKFTRRTLLNIYGTHSNIASATAAGFKFTEVGLRFKWQLLDRYK